MRTPSGATSGKRDTSTGKTGRALLSGVLAVSLAGIMALIPVPAQADPKPPVIPSQSAVDAAKKAAAAKAAQVAAIEQQLAAANDRLEQLGLQANKAGEIYNGAMYRLEQAKTEAAAAAQRAAKAEKTLAGQRQQIGRFAAASYQGGGELAKLGPLFTAEGPQELLESAGTAHSVSQAMQGSYLRFTATQLVSNAFKVQKQQAVVKVKAASDEAAKAKAAAEAAEAAQSAAVASIGTQRTPADRPARDAAQHLDQGRRAAAARSRRACPPACRGPGSQEGGGAAQADRRSRSRRPCPGSPRGGREGSRGAGEPEAERREEEAAEAQARSWRQWQ